MGQMHERITEAKAEKRRFSPAGQSTQVIVGADATTDAAVLTHQRPRSTAATASSASTTPPSARSPSRARVLPLKAPPLQRENRLYQADWLIRFYGFTVDEIAAGGADGMLDLDIDPKLAWALKHRDRFPVDVNRAARELLLRVPGLGVTRRRPHHPRAPPHAAAPRRPRPPLRRPAPRRALPHRRRPPRRPASTGSTSARRLVRPPEQLSLFG